MKYYINYGSRVSYFLNRNSEKCQMFRTIHNIWGEIDQQGKVKIYDKNTCAACKNYVESKLYVEVDPLWPHYQIIIPD
jgi:hypothetical protein